MSSISAYVVHSALELSIEVAYETLRIIINATTSLTLQWSTVWTSLSTTRESESNHPTWHKLHAFKATFLDILQMLGKKWKLLLCLFK